MRSLPWLLPLGIFLPALMPELPPVHWLGALVLVALLLLFHRRVRWLTPLLLGVCYAGFWGHGQLERRLPLVLDKTDVVVIGTIQSLPDVNPERSRFTFAVEQLIGSEILPPLATMQLSWYGAPPVQAGERWRLQVRLRTPRGFANPSGFDYEGWLFVEGIHATGYVRENRENRRLDPAPPWSLGGYRQRLHTRLQAQGYSPEATGFMAALILGDNSLISPASFERLVATGTVHLLVVSGLHVGMVAGLCFALALWFGKVFAALGVPMPAKMFASLVALAGALAYGAIAGFGLPIQRALVMTAVVLLAILLRRRASPWRMLAWALALVALIDPLAVIRQGFWLSFVAVGALLLWFVPRPATSRWRQAVQSQGVVWVSLAPFLMFFQGRASLLALPVNLVAIPWISLLVVPLCLLGALCQGMPVFEPIGNWLWQLAAWQLEGFGQLLVSAADLPLAGFARQEQHWLRASDWPLLLAGIALALCSLMPRGLPVRWPGLVLLLAVLLSRPQAPPGLHLAVLDVGQGLAAVVQVADKTLVYDTGPAFSSGFNTGAAVVAPYLASLGIYQIDKLVVSHGDNDHAGGVAGLLSQVKVDEIIAGQPSDLPAVARQCQRGQQWQWGDVTFSVLWPEAETQLAVQDKADNNRSCVLLVRAPGVAILLPGDVEKTVEHRLLAWDEVGELENLTVLVAPHHGSKTSSSSAFVAHANPRFVVFSTGFNHQFGHPHPEVSARYRGIGSNLLDTANSGALLFAWVPPGEANVTAQRLASRRYWHHLPQDGEP